MRPAVMIGVAAVLALVGCAGTRGAVGVSESEPVPLTGMTTPTTATTVPAADVAPLRCGDVDTAAPSVALTADAAVTAVTLCEYGTIYIPGSGEWSSWDAHVVPTDRVPTLVAALAQPSAAPDAERICLTNAVGVPLVAVALVDGTAVSAEVPSDGCHPQMQLVVMLGDIANTTPAVPEALALRTDDTALRAGCLGAKPLYPTPGQATTVDIPAGGSLSACDYVTGTDQDTRLRAATPVDVPTVRTLLAGLSPAPPAGCEPSAEVRDFVAVVMAPAATPADQRPPDSPSGGVPLFSVASTGCPVVVDGAWTILGWADPDDVAALVAATS